MESGVIARSMKSFRDASNLTLDFENKFFESQILLIKKYRLEFHLVAIDLIYTCDALVNFCEEFMIFVEFSSDESVSNENLLEFLDSSSMIAKKNKAEIESTLSKVKSLEINVTKVYETFAEFNSKFNSNDDKSIDPKTYDSLTNVKSSSSLYKASIAMGALGTTILLLTIPTGVFTAVAIAALSGGISRAVCKVESHKYNEAAKGKKGEASKYNELLNQNKKQIKDKSASLEQYSFEIDEALHQLKNFWGERLSELENILLRLKRSNNYGPRPSKMDAAIYKRRWERTIEKCKICSRAIKEGLEYDMKSPY